MARHPEGRGLDTRALLAKRHLSLETTQKNLTQCRPVDTASNSFVWSRGSGVFWQAVHACRGHGPRGDGPLCGWHVRGCNGSGRRGRGRLAGPAVAPAECSAGLARVQCDLWKDESQHNRSSTSSWEARDEWCPCDWIARQDVLFHDDGIRGAAS